MIIINKTFTITDPANKSPYAYQFIISPSCALSKCTPTITSLSGTTTTGVINATFTFPSEQCLQQVIASSCISLQITNSDGCVETDTVTFTNVCTSLDNGDITHTSPFVFSVNPTGGVTPYTYAWSYDPNVFINAGGTDDEAILTLDLNPKAASYPNSTDIYVTVSDSNGCVETTTYIYYFCSPSAQNKAVQMPCLPNGNRTAFVSLQASTCAVDRQIDWSTIDFTLPSGFSFTGSNGNYTFTALSTVASGLYNINWTVEDTFGVRSNQAVLAATVLSCTSPTGVTPTNNPQAASTTTRLLDATVVTDTFTKDLDDYVFSEEEIDWTSFTFVASTGQVLVSATELTANDGTATFDSNHVLTYEVTNLGTGCDPVQWKVADVNGQFTKLITEIFMHEVVAAPTAVNDTVCAACEVTTGPIDLTSNDTGDIDKVNIQVTEFPDPDEASIAVDENGEVYFTGTRGFSGTATMKYKVPNFEGELSNEATVDIDVVCVGTPPTGSVNITCFASLAFDLETLLEEGVADVNTVWTEVTTGPSSYTTQGGTIGGGSSGSVDFSAINPGTYIFNASATDPACLTATSSYDITLVLSEVNEYSNNDCTGAIVITYPVVSGVPSTVFNQSNLDNCPVATEPTDTTVNSVPASPEQSPPTWNATHSGDLWYTFTTTAASFTLAVKGSPYGSDGVQNPQVVIYSSGGSPCTLNDFVHEADAAVTGGTQDVSLATTLAISTQYWIRMTTGGTSGNGLFDISITGA